MNEKPSFSYEEAQRIVLENWNLKCLSVKRLESYDDQNFCIVGTISHSGGKKEQGTWALKVMRRSFKRNAIEMHNKVYISLRSAKINAPFPVCCISGDFIAKVDCHQDDGTLTGHYAWLLEWVHGKDMKRQGMDLAGKMNIMEQWGEMTARVDNAFSTFDQLEMFYNDNNEWAWRPSNFLMIKEHMWAVEKRHGKERLKIAEDLIEQYQSEISKAVESLPMGVIHSDLNDDNVIVSEDGCSLSGVIDICDIVVDRYCFEVGITMFYAMLFCDSKNIWEVAKRFIKGYTKHRSLSDEEIRYAIIGTKLRALVSVVTGGAAQELRGDDPYIGQTEKPGWILLEKLHSYSDEELYNLVRV